MSDAHRRFTAWLVAGAPGEPPRDAALHASVCAECTAGVAALDARATIDPGRALLPPSIRAPQQRAMPLLRTPALAATAVLVIALGIGASVASGPTRGEQPGGAVLGATGTPAATRQAAAPTTRPPSPRSATTSPAASSTTEATSSAR